jgi:hypothetical protein
VDVDHTFPQCSEVLEGFYCACSFELEADEKSAMVVLALLFS